MMEFIPIARAAEEATTSAGPAATLGLNLKLFIGQLVNFGLLLFIFWKWILPRVTKALQERSARIEKAMRDASTTEKEKHEFFAWKETEMTKVRSQAQAIITAAQSEAGKAKKQIEEETKDQQQRIIQQAKEQIEQEKNQTLQAAKNELADLVTNATEKILRHKLDEHKDKEFIEETLKSI